jgi:hypothetical protein
VLYRSTDSHDLERSHLIMRVHTPQSLRIPLILLSVVNLVLLAARVWPWTQVLGLPGNGATAIDPAVSLLGYIALTPWILGSLQEKGKKASAIGSAMGLAAGILLVVEVVVRAQIETTPAILEIGLLVAAALLWGFAGLRSAWDAGSSLVGMLAGAWSAMVSCLLASTAVLAESFRSTLPPPSTDPWQQYQGLAIGSPETQALVHSLNTATGFLLIGPMVGCVFGLVFAFFQQNKKTEAEHS